MRQLPDRWSPLCLTFALSLCFAGYAHAANVEKLIRECRAKDANACPALEVLAANPKERANNRIEAIQALSDEQFLAQMVASGGAGDVEKAVKARLQELLSADFLHAAENGDSDALKALARKGAPVDPHPDALEVGPMTIANGSYEYLLVCAKQAMASPAMLAAIRSGRPEAVRTLIALGADTKREYVFEEASVAKSPIPPQEIKNAICAGDTNAGIDAGSTLTLKVTPLGAAV